jgi:hypothetical protein
MLFGGKPYLNYNSSNAAFTVFNLFTVTSGTGSMTATYTGTNPNLMFLVIVTMLGGECVRSISVKKNATDVIADFTEVISQNDEIGCLTVNSIVGLTSNQTIDVAVTSESATYTLLTSITQIN